MPRAKPTQDAKPVAKREPAPLAAVAVLHRESDAPALEKWLSQFIELLPAELSKDDHRDLIAVGAGMSVWQRTTLLNILLKYCT